MGDDPQLRIFGHISQLIKMQQFMVPTVSQILVKYGSISIILFIQIL
jgi:hypothetical protein